MFQIHLWTGLLVGLFVGTVGLTGAIVVFRYELNRLTVPGTAYVEPLDQRLTLDELTAQVQLNRPEDRIAGVSWEVGPSVAWNYRSYSPDGHRIHTFINQYTGEITGQENYQHKTLQFIFDLHAYLLAGDTGLTINGFVALASILLAVTGLVVWWPGLGRWRFGFQYLTTARWERQNYDLHKLVGFFFILPIIVVSFTGAYFSFPSLYKAAASALTGTVVSTDEPVAMTRWRDRRVPIEEFVRAAELAQPGARAISVGFPAEDGRPISVRLKERRDWHRVGLNRVYLEPANAHVLESARFGSSSAGTQIIRLMFPLHFGRFGGRWGPTAFYGVMVVYVLVGIAPFALMVTGLLMYWNRSFSKRWRRLTQTRRRPRNKSENLKHRSGTLKL